MPQFLFRILCIVIGIIIWKAVASSFSKVKKAMRDDDPDTDSDTDDDTGDEAEEDVTAPQATVFRNEQWKLAAQQLGCTFDPGKRSDGRDVSFSGKVSGYPVTVKRFGYNYVRYFVAFRKPLQSRICVVQDLEPIAKRILDGRPVFSSKMFFSSREPVFFCSADSEEAFDRFLNVPSNRSAVLNLVRTFPAGMFNPEGVSVRLRAMTPDVGTVRQMIALARTLEAPSGDLMPDLMAAQKKDLVSIPPVQPLRSGPPAEEEDTPKRFQPIQIGGEYRWNESPAPAPDLSPATSPSEAGDNRSGDSAATSPGEAGDNLSGGSAITSPGEAGDNRSGGSASMDVESVCSVLFAKSFPGAEERAAFDAMKGRRVRWSGELQMCLPFSMDFTFGSRRGVKATLLVCRIAQGHSGTPVTIKAVAAFPPEQQRELEAAKGRTVVFSGEILKFEPFAREIYLQDARLEA